MSDIPFLLTWRPFQTANSFSFKDPDSGRIHYAATRQDLINLIISYREQNGYEALENLPLVLDNYLCMLPENSGKCTPYFPIKRGLWASLKGGVALIETMLYKSFAPKEEADRRAKICIKCPHNSFPDKGRFIKWSDAVAEASVGSRRSSHHEELGNCAVCSCPLRAKVFYNGKIELSADEVEVMKKVGCWQTEPLKTENL